MKAIKDETMEAMEDLAVEGVKHLRAYFEYEGENTKYFKRARLSAVTISNFARLRASETNRMAIEFAAQKMLLGDINPAKLITDGDGN